MSRFIVIDGLDGTGKATQVKLLEEELGKKGYTVHHIEFPAYAENSSWPVREYLNGSLGSNPNELNPYMCASFYAVDRMIQYHKGNRELFELDDTHVIVADRYISANIIHQGSKISNDENRAQFAEWCYHYEHNLCGIPLEDATIILTVPVKISQALMTRRYGGDESRKDIHEKNTAYLETCGKALAKTLRQLSDRQVRFPVPWYELQCLEMADPKAKKVEDMYSLASIETVHAHVMEIVEPLLEGDPIKAGTYCCFFGLDQYKR